MIKRMVLIVIVLALTASTTLANPSIGLRIGMGSYTMLGVQNDVTNVNRGFGGGFGIFYTQLLGGNIFFIPWIMLMWHGFTKVHLLNTAALYDNGVMLSSANQTQEATEDVSLGYIQIPLVLRYDIPIKGKLKPRVLLGPSFAFNISSKNKISGFGEYDGEYNIGNLKTLDLRGMIGGGVSFPVGKLKFGVDVIYEQGFSSAFNDVSEEELANDVNEELWTKTDPVTFERTTEAVDFKNSGFSFQASIILPIGKDK